MRHGTAGWAAAALAFCVAGCGQVTPPLSHATNNFPVGGSIPVREVVNRVKCELALAFIDKIADPTKKKEQADPQYQWLQNWTAEIDLTLQINEQGGLTPSASYMLPLKNFYNRGPGPSTLGGSTINATQQSFSFGFGGTYTGDVVRTELLNFALSLKELKEWYDAGGNNDCNLPDGLDLEGRFDLKSWVDEVFKPIDADELQSGNHVAPTIQKGSTTQSKAGQAGQERQQAVEAKQNLTTKAEKSEQERRKDEREREQAYFLGLTEAVRTQLLSPSCISLAGNNETSVKDCQDAKTQTGLLKAICTASANTDEMREKCRVTDNNAELLRAICPPLAVAAVQAGTTDKRAQAACKAARAAQEGYPPLGPNTDPTFYASSLSDALGQAVSAAKQAVVQTCKLLHRQRKLEIPTNPRRTLTKS